jgi:Trypsin/FG-GAP-like repeat
MGCFNRVIMAMGLVPVLWGCGVEGQSTDPVEIEESAHALQNGTVVTYPFAGTDSIARAVVSVNGGCTATLLNDNWVITARHCVGDGTGPVIKAATVHHYPKNLDRTVPIASIFVHPDPDMDVALLQLPSPISSGQGAISLFQGEDAAVVGKNVTTYGYGLVDVITDGCLNGKACPATYFCNNDANGAPKDCVLNNNVLNGNCPTNPCPSTHPICDSYSHCTVSPSGSGRLRKATFTVNKVVRDNSMNSNPVYNGKYLNLPKNSSNQWIRSGDSGGPTFINGQLVGITGGTDWVTYAKAFRNWAKGIMSPSTNNGIGAKTGFYNNVAPGGTQLRTGDVNNDGYTDIIQFNQDLGPQGSVYVIRGKSGGFETMARWHTSFSTGTQVPQVADVDGDAKADIITFDQSNGYVYVALSNGSSGFGTKQTWHTGFSYAGETARVGDVNGDGRADIITFVHYNNWGEVWVSLSCGTDSAHYPTGCTGSSKFGTRIHWAGGFSLLNQVPWVGDVNNDGLADLVTFEPGGNSYVALSRRHSCTTNTDCGSKDTTCWTALGICPDSLGEGSSIKTYWGYGYFPGLGDTVMLADMNGDGYVDAVDFETVSGGRNGIVGVGLSNGSSFGSYITWGTGFCKQGEVCAVGDVNRDGKSDVFEFIPGGLDSYSLSNP